MPPISLEVYEKQERLEICSRKASSIVAHPAHGLVDVLTLNDATSFYPKRSVCSSLHLAPAVGGGSVSYFDPPQRVDPSATSGGSDGVRRLALNGVPGKVKHQLSGIAQHHAHNLLERLTPTEKTTGLRKNVVDIIEGALQNLSACTIVGGSFAKGTDLEGTVSDVDMVVIFEDFSPDRYGTLLDLVEKRLQSVPSIHGLKRYWDSDRSVNFELEKKDIRTQVDKRVEDAQQALHSKHLVHIAGTIEFEDRSPINCILFDPDALPESSRICAFDVLVGGKLPERGYVDLLLSCGPRERPFWGASLVSRHVNLLAKQPPHVRQAVRMAKWWKHEIAMVGQAHTKPKSFLLELLILHADANLKQVEKQICPCSLFTSMLHLISAWKDLQVVWSWGTLLASGKLEFGKNSSQCPTILDPVNPTNNVAHTVRDWSLLGRIAGDTLHLMGDIARCHCKEFEFNSRSERCVCPARF